MSELISDTGLGRFLRWWTGELAAMVPGPVRRLVLGAPARLAMSLGEREIGLALFRGGRPAAEATLPQPEAGDTAALGEARARLRAIAGMRPGALGGVSLHLPRALVLSPEIALPIAAAGNLREVLAAEMDRHTPFAAGEVFFDALTTGADIEAGRLTVRLLVARRRDVEAALGVAAALGLSPDRVGGPAGTQAGDPRLNLLPPERRPAPGRLLPRLVAATGGLTLVLAVLAAGLWYQRESALGERTAERLAALRAQAVAARRFEDRMSALAALHARLVERKRASPQAVAVIDALSRSLPDDSFLASLTLEGGGVEMEGFSGDSSRVLRRVEETDLFAEARFIGPVRRDPGLEKERFRLAARFADPVAGGRGAAE